MFDRISLPIAVFALAHAIKRDYAEVSLVASFSRAPYIDNDNTRCAEYIPDYYIFRDDADVALQ